MYRTELNRADRVSAKESHQTDRPSVRQTELNWNKHFQLLTAGNYQWTAQWISSIWTWTPKNCETQQCWQATRQRQRERGGDEHSGLTTLPWSPPLEIITTTTTACQHAILWQSLSVCWTIVSPLLLALYLQPHSAHSLAAIINSNTSRTMAISKKEIE